MSLEPVSMASLRSKCDLIIEPCSLSCAQMPVWRCRLLLTFSNVAAMPSPSLSSLFSNHELDRNWMRGPSEDLGRSAPCHWWKLPYKKKKMFVGRISWWCYCCCWDVLARGDDSAHDLCPAYGLYMGFVRISDTTGSSLASFPAIQFSTPVIQTMTTGFIWRHS